jgi:hypothetical protein
MSMTPMAGLTLGGGGGNAAWPKACVLANNAARNVTLFMVLLSLFYMPFFHGG